MPEVIATIRSVIACLRPTRIAGHWLFVVLSCAILAGCDQTIITKSLPAPLREETEYILEGRVDRVWGGDHFEFGDQQELHYIIVRGVDCPHYGQKYHSQSRHWTMDITAGKTVRIEVVGRDEMMVEVADVFVDAGDPSEGEINIGLELLRLGLGWYDGNVFEGSEQYRAAHQEAKQKRIGLWSQDDPVSPGDFESAINRSILEKLKL